MSVRWLMLGLLGLVTVLSAIAVAYGRHQHRVAFAELARLERERDELNIEFDRLQIQIATLVDSRRIEQQAITRLGMRYPDPADVVVLAQ
ncbi:MAG: cell division protein FtsL [Xanthomonadales bacterium]|jgi:cell division protein FtsL|nr:cell division protein FtsL [Xanthomonadales bacterium]